jgi:hypothetical protein
MILPLRMLIAIAGERAGFDAVVDQIMQRHAGLREFRLQLIHLHIAGVAKDQAPGGRPDAQALWHVLQCRHQMLGVAARAHERPRKPANQRNASESGQRPAGLICECCDFVEHDRKWGQDCGPNRR